MMKRRDFLKGLIGLAALPLAVKAGELPWVGGGSSHAHQKPIYFDGMNDYLERGTGLGVDNSVLSSSAGFEVGDVMSIEGQDGLFTITEVSNSHFTFGTE